MTRSINPVGFAKVFDAARRVLAPVAGESGVPVLLLDDAHRLDSTSLTMIDRLLAMARCSASPRSSPARRSPKR